MSYTIDIIDTTDPDVVLEVKKSGAKTLNLSWHGSDKRQPGIVASSFTFTMVDFEGTDGKFDVLFTGNETKYKVNVIHDASGDIVWQGFILPDLYNEPYRKRIVMVDFQSVCGLGRLQGKSLGASFYSDEKSVVEIISECLRTTGLELDLYFAPAIENSVQKDYDAIDINTTAYVDGNKKQDAYTILNNLVNDMICEVYQCENRWYVVGINKKQLKVITYKHYNSAGVYQGEVEVTRARKEHRSLVTPNVTIVAPFGKIVVEQPVTQPSLPATLTQESNDGWSVPAGTTAIIYPTNWLGYGSYDAFAEAYDYLVKLPVTYGKLFTDLDTTKYIRLREKVYVNEGDKFHFKVEMDLSLDGITDGSNTTVDWYGGTYIELLVNDVLTKNVQFYFAEKQFTKTIEFDFVVQDSGLLDIKIYEPFLTGGRIYNNMVNAFVLRTLDIKKLNDATDIYIEDVVNDEFTLVKEVPLTIGDGVVGDGSIFQLAKLKNTGSYITKEVEVKYGFTFNGNYYSVVSLQGANLIADNIDQVYYDSVQQTDLEVIYNYNKGEEMVIKTGEAIGVGEVFEVRVYPINSTSTDRSTWLQWTDSIYGIEKDRYAQVVANIWRRLHNVAHYKVDMTMKRSVKYTDLITFPYKQDQDYVPTNVSWDLDSNETTVTAIKGYYLNDVVTNPTDNILPIVDAGPDQVLQVSESNATVEAVASDPDGFIASWQWEQVSGEAELLFLSPSSPTTDIVFLTGTGDYVIKVTVTDNEGATASDTLTIRKDISYTIDMTMDCVTDRLTERRDANDYNRRRVLGFSIDPALPDGTALTLTLKFTTFEIARHTITGYTDYLANPTCVLPSELPPQIIDDGGRRGGTINPDGYNPAIGLAVMKNGALVYGAASGTYTNPDIIEVSVIAGTELFMVLESGVTIYDSAESNRIIGTNINRKIELQNVVVSSGAGTVTGFPETIEVYENYDPALITPSIEGFTQNTTSVDLDIIDLNSDSTETINIYVEYCVDDDTDNWQSHGNVSRTATSYSVTGLVADTFYKFRIKSVVTIDVFESEYSNELETKTLAA